MHPLVKSLGKSVLGGLNRPVARARFRRAAGKAPRPISLEIGGRGSREGWFVTDVGALTRMYLDATKPWPFEAGSLDLVYADNMLEHVSLDGARAFLAEAHRCMRPGAVIRLVTPDVRRHVELYLQGRSAIDSTVATRYRNMGVVVEHPVDLARIPIGEFGHHTGYAYDFDALAAELARAGFTDVENPAIGESRHPKLVGLEARQDEGQAQVAAEATR